MKHHAKQDGFSLLDLLMIVVAIAAIILVVLPGLLRPRRNHSPEIRCHNNLKQVGLAFRIWASDNNEKFPSQTSITNGGAKEWAAAGSAYGVFLVMSNELSTPKLLFCPGENNPSRQVASTLDFSQPQENSAGVTPFTATNNLSYFAGLDGDQTQIQTILTGDDHLLVGKTPTRSGLLLVPTNTPVTWAKGRHMGNGNITRADGSVQQFNASGLQRAFDNSGFATNRLALP
jgi:prepilin-type processing-associated H-X9-DG protein